MYSSTSLQADTVIDPRIHLSYPVYDKSSIPYTHCV